MLAVSAAAEFLRCTEAAHLICTCKAFNNDPGLRDRTTAGSRRAERAQDAAAAKAAATAVEKEQELIQLWREFFPERSDIGTGIGIGTGPSRFPSSPTLALARAFARARRESQQDGIDEFEIDEDVISEDGISEDGITAADEFDSDLEAFEQHQLTFEQRFRLRAATSAYGQFRAATSAYGQY